MQFLGAFAARKKAAVFFRSLRFVLALFLAAPLISLTTALPAAAQTYAFTSFAIEGNERIEDASILSFAGITPGQPISAADLNAGYQRVVATGLFESVDFVPQGRRLVIRVVEYPTINRISIEGNRSVRDEVAEAVIQSKPRLAFNPNQAEADAAAIVRLYQNQGRLSAVVTPKIIRRSGNRVDLVFEVQESARVEVERISFTGNQAYSDGRLRRVLSTRQAGTLRALVSSDTFVEDRVEFDKRLLTDFYQARGYVDFQVLSVNSEFSRERNAFFITFNVREGQPYSFGKVSTVSEIDGVDAADYEGAVRIASGRTYTPELVDAAIARIEKLALRNGQNLLRVDPRVTRDDRNRTLDITFALVRGPRVFVERIDITGNATTLDRVIRQQFRVVEGDPFNPREIREAAERIRALNLFTSAGVAAREGSAADQVIVDVDVEEALTGSLSFGAAYNFTTGVGLTANFRERNLLGRGQTLNADVVLGLDNASGGVTFIEPAFLGRDLEFRFDGEYRLTEYDYTDYDTQNVLFQPSIEFPVTETGRLELRYGLSNDKIYNVSPKSSPVLKAEQKTGAVLASAIGYTYSFDNRRSGISADQNLTLRFGQDFGGLGGDVQFIKTTALASAERDVLGGDVTLRATVEGGVLNTIGSNSRLTERFFLTSQKMRGFAPAGVGPRDLTVKNRDALGGNYFAVARFEAEFPLGLPQELGINGGLFFDVGSLWGLDNTNGGAVDDGIHLRATAGFAILWDTPIGPLRFNFSKVIQREKYDKPQTFDLTISTQF